MLKELIVALACAVTCNAAARVPHGEPVKKQAVYSNYVPPYNVFQDSHYYPTPYPQGQAGVIAQGQSPQVTSGSAGTTGTSLKQPVVPQKSSPYPTAVNPIPATQYPSYPFKQYYPQIYPQNSQYPSVPSVFYVPSQGRFPSTANEVASSAEQGTGAGTTGSNAAGSASNWYQNWGQNVPNWPNVPQVPQYPQYPANFPNFPQYPANLPQFPSYQPPQFPSFPGGNFPNFPGSAPAGSAPAGAPPTAVTGSETGSSGVTSAEGNSVVVVGARRPEKIENADSNAEGTKNDAGKVTADFPAQQYILLGQPQYLLQNGGQVPVAQNAGAKDSLQSDAATKGAGSAFLFQQQPIGAQQAQVQQFPQIPQNKIFTPQEFQELIQQIQASNKKLLENNNGAVPQFYFQQSLVPQRGNAQPTISSLKVPQGASQDVTSQQVSGVVPPQYLFPGLPSTPQVQQPFLISPQQQQLFAPQFTSVPQPKPFGDVSTVPGASLAYQRFILENQRPINPSVVGVQNVEGGAPVSGAGPTPITIPSSVSSTVSANDSSSSPEPSSHNDENDSTGNTSDSDIRNETNEIPVNEDATPTSENDLSSVTVEAKSNEQRKTYEFGDKLSTVKPKTQI